MMENCLAPFPSSPLHPPPSSLALAHQNPDGMSLTYSPSSPFLHSRLGVNTQVSHPVHQQFIVNPGGSYGNSNTTGLNGASTASKCGDISFRSSSSPSVSLATDMSQNFHIVRSPVLVTPRRALFTSKLFPKDALVNESHSTPPLSSPSICGMDIDDQDYSPLPRNASNIVAGEENVPLTPAIEDSEEDSNMASSTDFLPGTNSANIKVSPSARNKCRRSPLSSVSPSLSCTENDENQFENEKGQGCSVEDNAYINANSKQRQSTPGSPTLSELFEQESPVREPRFCGTGQSMFKGKQSRKSSNPFIRPRTQYQRSWSMFESPQGMIVETDNDDNATQTVYATPLAKCGRLSFPNMRDVDIDVMDSQPILRLPHFIPDDQSDNLPRIDKFTLLDIINGKYKQQFERVLVIDCRFEYEYDGGHIQGAINHWDKESLADKLLEPSLDNGDLANTALILHCEFSIHRAPIMARYIRHRDRAVNVNEYPKLSYPELYILDGGYNSFFESHRDCCEPPGYVEMGKEGFEQDRERGLALMKKKRATGRNMSKRSGLERSQTFTFGSMDMMDEESASGVCPENQCAGRRMMTY